MDNEKALIVLVVALVVIAAGTVIFLTTGKTQQNEVYTVTFVSDDGTVITTQKVEQGGKAVMPEAPVKEGHVFIGWTYSGLTYDFSSKIESNLTLEAKWQEVKQDVIAYTVSFNSDGGTTIENQIVEKDAKVERPADPTKEGYTFKGWMLNEAEYNFDTSVTENVQLKAKWEEVKENKEEDKEESKDKLETITVKKPTLSIPAEGPGSAQLSIVFAGAYKSGTKTISGWELYEKNGSKYTKVYSSIKAFETKVTVDVGESKTYVARAYAYDKSNKKVYSAYSNEVKVEDILAKPTLSAGAGGPGSAILTIGLKGAYDTELALKQVDGYELYEKVGTKYTKLDSWEVTADVGETRIFVARVYAYNKSNKKVYSAYSNEYKLTNSVEKPTLSTPAGGPGSAIFDVVSEGAYANGTELIDGWELYEKNGSKYILVHTSETNYTKQISVDVGESKIYVARVYAYNKSNVKVYSAYSNEKKLENKVQTPTLSTPAGSQGTAIFDIAYQGAYANGTELIDGWELYEKNGSKYTLVHTSETNYTKQISVGVGESKIYVARVYAYNKSNVKVYSEYSNEIKLENKVQTPTLSTPAGGPGSAIFDVAYQGAYANGTELIDGWELYEKNGSKYTLVHTSETNYTKQISVGVGESKTYVARVYAYNKSNVKIYSAYSNTVVLSNIQE